MNANNETQRNLEKAGRELKYAARKLIKLAEAVEAAETYEWASEELCKETQSIEKLITRFARTIREDYQLGEE